MAEKYTKYFDSWNKQAKSLDERAFIGILHEREIWWCALGVNIGSEQDGKNELLERPVLLIRYMRPDLWLIAPITTKIATQEDRIQATVAGQQSQILLSQIRVVSNKRFLRKIGTLKLGIFRKVVIDLISLILLARQSETPP